MASFLLLVTAAASPAAGFDLHAHRGGRGLAPENSLAAFGRALALGVATLELDLVVSRDEQILIGHDLELDPAEVRTADGRWLVPPGPAVHILEAAPLRRFDIGRSTRGRLDPASPDARRFPDQRPADGERMPTLAELAALLDARGPTGAAPRLVAAAGCRIRAALHASLAPPDIRPVETLGLLVVPRTVDEPERMRELVGQDVHGPIADYPERLRAVLAAIGLPLPPAFP